MTKKNLSVVALVIQIISIFLLYIDGIFIWYAHNYEENISITNRAFNWLFDTQFDMFIFVFLMVVLLVLNVIVEIITLFKEITFLKNKYMLLLPIITLVIFVSLCMWGNSYSDTFTYNGELRKCSVGLGFLYYVEFVLLGAVVLIEALKHYTKIPYTIDKHL